MRSMKIEITKDEKKRLERVIKEKKDIYSWKRAKAVLLYESGIKIKDISKIFGVHRNSTGRWLKEWREEKKLFGKTGRGSKQKLTEEMKIELEKYIRENPLSITKAHQMIKEKYNISIHRITIVRHIKKTSDTKELNKH